MWQAGAWEPTRQTANTTCPYCGVGCTLTIYVQDERIGKITSTIEQEVTHGHLCVKGRFGWDFVNRRK
jgi:NADP-reducing hydrogenase subunit HndD